MNANFAPSLTLVLQHEGGFVDDPKDPGGRTNEGVTQAVYNDWRASEGLPPADVKLIGQWEVQAIYRKLYWAALSADLLPFGVDYAAFDFAVNSGVNRATRFLQKAVDVSDDGQIGPVTIAAVNARSAAQTIDALCDARLDFLKHLSVFDRFGRGWTTRVADVRAKAKQMAGAMA